MASNNATPAGPFMVHSRRIERIEVILWRRAEPGVPINTRSFPNGQYQLKAFLPAMPPVCRKKRA